MSNEKKEKKDIKKEGKETIKKAVEKGKSVVSKTKDSVVQVMDADGNGQIDINDIIVLAIKTPGIHVDRASFLKKELFKNHPQEVIDDAIERTPALAGISKEEIDKIADEVIKFERVCVSGISAALGVPGGWAMAATIPADIIQYYAYTLRAMQKMLYLYGFPDIKVDKEGAFLDSEILNEIILCLGIMNGVAGANNAIKGLAKALAIGVEKQLLKKALTKGAVFPIVKSVLKYFGITLTKKIFAGFFKNVIPIAGGVIGGGVTFLAFKPCCNRLKEALKDTLLSNPDHVSSKEEEDFVDKIIKGEVIEGDYKEIDPEIEPFTAEEIERELKEEETLKEMNEAKE